MSNSESSVCDPTRAFSREVLQQAARIALRARWIEQFNPKNADQQRTHGVIFPSLKNTSDSLDQASTFKQKYDDVATQNILDLFGEIASSPPEQLTVETLHDFHRRLLQETEESKKTSVGQFRDHGVEFGGFKGADSHEAEAMVTALLHWAEDPATDPLPQLRLASALIKALVVHAKILAIHPYADGNGRVARFVEFALLVSAGFPLALAHEFHNLYNDDRSAYVHKLANDMNGDIESFLLYALEGVNKRLLNRVETEKNETGVARRQLLRAGFTIIEVVLVLLILGILAGVAAPKLFSTSSSAETAIEQQIVRRVQDGIELYYLEKLSTGAPEFPTSLDSVGSGSICRGSSPCFIKVLNRGISDNDWQKVTSYEYQAPSGNTYVYNPSTGEFLLDDGSGELTGTGTGGVGGAPPA